MWRFGVGNLECAVLYDGDITFSPELILPPSRRSEWPPIELDARGDCSVPINCLLVRSEGRTVLVDTGNGSRPGKRFPGGGRLLEELAAAGVEPEGVDMVVVTHGHEDHVGGATTYRDGRFEPTFPRARYLLPRADWEHFTTPERLAQPGFARDCLLPLAEHGRLELVEGEEVAGGISLLRAPGHTSGQCAVLLHSEGQSALYLSDIFHHPAQFEQPDLVRDGELLPGVGAFSRGRMAQLALDRSALVLLAHEPHPGLGRLAWEQGRVVFHPL